MHCYYYSALCISFLNDLKKTPPQFALFPADVFVKTLVYGNPIFEEGDNHKVL